MINFLFARHRMAYIGIGLRHLVWPEHVYDLAHGKSAHGKTDTKICHDLLERKIVHRHHQSHDSSDYDM